MIDPSTLRIGNYVQVGNLIDSEPRKILGYDKETLVLSPKRNSEHKSDLVEIENVYPIHITPKILINSGFKEQEFNKQNLSTDYIFDYIIITRYSDRSFLIRFDIDMLYIKQIKYVHDLQNFYKCTRDKELQITFKK